MITSGLLVQNRAHFRGYPSRHEKDNVLMRPYVDGFDKGITKVSDPFQIGPNGLPPAVPKNRVNFRDVFGRSSTADERAQNVGKMERRSIPRLGGRRTNFYSQNFNNISENDMSFPPFNNPYVGGDRNEYRDNVVSSEISSTQTPTTTDSDSIMKMEIDKARQYQSSLHRALSGGSPTSRENDMLTARIHNLGVFTSPTGMTVDKKGMFDIPDVDPNAIHVDLPSPIVLKGVTPPPPPPPPVMNFIQQDKLANTLKKTGKKVATESDRIVHDNGVTKDAIMHGLKNLKRMEVDPAVPKRKGAMTELAEAAAAGRGSLKKTVFVPKLVEKTIMDVLGEEIAAKVAAGLKKVPKPKTPTLQTVNPKKTSPTTAKMVRALMKQPKIVGAGKIIKKNQPLKINTQVMVGSSTKSSPNMMSGIST